MDRYVIMVDAGYLLRQAVDILSDGAASDRRDVEITDYPGLVAMLDASCREAFGFTNGSRELLRIYWYDGVPHGRPTQQQNELMKLPGVQFRAGTVNFEGRQKGVDSMLVLDLIELAANSAICDAAIVSGDGDLTVGIERAQKNGVRVALIGIEQGSISHKQSFEVLSIADRVHRIGAEKLGGVMRYLPPQAGTDASEEERIRELVVSFLSNAASNLEDPFEDASHQIIRQSVYRELMAHVGAGLGQWLSKEEKNLARNCFRILCEEREAGGELAAAPAEDAAGDADAPPQQP